jgi:hypothetical protein
MSALSPERSEQLRTGICWIVVLDLDAGLR